MPLLALVLTRINVEYLRIGMAVLMLFGPMAVLICGLRMERKPAKEIGSKKGYCPKEPCTDRETWNAVQRIAATYYINGSLIGLAVSAVLIVIMVKRPVRQAVLMLPITVAVQFAGLLLLYGLINGAVRRMRRKRNASPTEETTE